MNSPSKPLTLFLAVPGTDLGEKANWKRPSDVLLFFKKVADELERRVGCKIQFIVEKERLQAGAIHSTMFRAAYEADIFIADLTGSNPNVCLELGVRLALRRGITLLVNQDSALTPFDVGHMRVIQYANGPDDPVIDKIIAFIEQALTTDNYCDSPVLDVLDLEIVSRSHWAKVSNQRVQRLLQSVGSTRDTDTRISLLYEAIEIDSLNVEIRLNLARKLRQRERYQESMKLLDEGIDLTPDEPALHHERGLVLSRISGEVGQTDYLQQAVEALQRSVALAPEDADAQASLGGALRRLGLARAPHHCDWGLLLDSANHYQMALKLDRHNTYPALNLVRLGLLLNNHKEVDWDNKALLEKTYHLCAFEAIDRPQDYWLALDLADTQLFRGKAKDSREKYRRAIQLIPVRERADVLRSPLSTLLELTEIGALKGRVGSGAREIIEDLQSDISTNSQLNEEQQEQKA